MKPNTFYSYLIPLLICVMTIMGFLLLMPEQTTVLYWVNMVYILIIEALFFGWFQIGKSGVQTSQFKIFLGVNTFYYVLASLILVLVSAVYSSSPIQALVDKNMLPTFSMRLYLFCILLITMIWILTGALVGRRDAGHHAQQTTLENNTDGIRTLVEELKNLESQHASPSTEREWKRLIRDAASIPPSQLTAKQDEMKKRAANLINLKQ